MVLSSRIATLSVPFAYLLASALVGAAPREDYQPHARVDLSDKSFGKREDQDDTEADIAADGTGPLRDALDARNDVYLKQSTATWYQLDPGPVDASASFTVFADTTSTTILPQPNDPKQTQNPGNGDLWDVDHILELQILAVAFSPSNKPTVSPTSIPDATWTAVSQAIFTKGAQVTALASKITVLDNLQGIPNRVNGFKKNVVRGNLTGKNYPGSKTYYGFFGPGVQKYLSGAKGRLFGQGGVVDNVGSELQSIGNGEQAVKDYFTSYASFHYQGCIDYLSTWSGLSYTRTAATSSGTTSSGAGTTAGGSGGATPTCEHAADPENTCAAIASATGGWCDCGNSNKYITKKTGQPCAWTTLPATTSFDCPITSAPVAKQSSTPPSPTKKCTLRDIVIGGGRDPLITHSCTCNDGSTPSPTVNPSRDVYVCPDQVTAISG